MTREPKTRRTRKHATGISAKCRSGQHADCTMLECQDDCHSSERIDFEPTFEPMPGVFGLP